MEEVKILFKKKIKWPSVYSLACVAISIYISIALLAPFIVSIDPFEMSTNTLSLPDPTHLLGTNDIGQDLWSQLIFATRQSLLTSLSVATITTGVALILGTYGALENKLVDRLILRITDVFLAIPELVICLIVTSMIRPSYGLLVIILCVLEWPVPLKLIRAQVIQEKNNNYVLAAQTFGAHKSHLLKTHIIKRISPLIMVMFVRNATIAVFMESGLAFLGFLNGSEMSWGRMIADAMPYTYLPIWRFWLLPTGLVLSGYILSLTYLGRYFEQLTEKRGGKIDRN